MTDQHQAGTDPAARLGLLRNSRFLYFWLGQTVSQLGDGISMMTTVWQSIALTDSRLTQGSIFAVLAIPRLVVAMIGGVMSDRWNRFTIMIVVDSVRGVTGLAIGILSLTGHLRLPWLYLYAVIAGLTEALFAPSGRAVVPSLVQQAHLGRANAFTETSRQAGTIVAPMVGGMLVAMVGPGAGYVVDGLTFVVSVVTLLLVVRLGPAVVSAVRRATGSFWSMLVAGVSFTFRQPFLRAQVVAATFVNLALPGTTGLALPHLLLDRGLGPEAHGLATGAFGVGSALGAALLLWKPPAKRQARLVFSSAAASGLLWALVPIMPSLPLVSLIMALMGVAFTAVLVVSRTITQSVVEPAMLGRTMAVLATAGLSLIPLSYALTGLMLDRVPPAWIIISGGGLMAVTGAFGLLSAASREAA